MYNEEYLKNLESNASVELSEYYRKDLQAYFGETIPERNIDPAHLIVYDISADKLYYDNDTINFISAADKIEELSSFKEMYDIYEIESIREKITELEQNDPEVFTKALIANQLNINDMNQLNAMWQNFIENENIKLMNDEFYKTKYSKDKYQELTKFKDRDGDGIEDWKDLDPDKIYIDTSDDYEKIKHKDIDIDLEI